MENVLANNAEQYIGQYVTTADFDHFDVITHSPDAVIAYNEAVKKGHPDPVLVYIPHEGE